MSYIEAVLVKRRTDDGLVEIHDHVPLGRSYLVEVRTRRRVQLFNVEHGVAHEKEIVNVQGGGWFPTELLHIPEGLA